jgi:competence protein ComEA
VTEPPANPSPPLWAVRLAGWRDARPRRHPGVAAAGAAAVLVAVVAGVLLFRRPAAPPPEVVLPRANPDAGATTPGTTEPEQTVTVHAAGALVRPGVYVLPAGSRVADAVAAAGGPSPEADLHQLNLATRVGDGDRVHLPRKGEASAGAPAATVGGAGATPGPTRPQVLDLNAAGAEELEALPGVGPALARAIVEHRTRNGRFRTVDDLVDVPGIGPAKLAALRPLVRV